MEQLSQLKPPVELSSVGGQSVDVSPNDETSMLDAHVERVVPHVRQGIQHMLEEVKMFGGWVGEIAGPREAEAGGFSFVTRQLGKKAAKTLLLKNAVRYFRKGQLTKEEFFTHVKRIKTDPKYLEEHIWKGVGPVAEPVFPLTSKPTFQLENLRSLLKKEPNIRYKHLREKLPKLFPLLKEHNWNGEKLTVAQVSKHLAGKKSPFIGRWGKWEPQGEETWIRGEADDVLAVMPIKETGRMQRQLYEIEDVGTHPPAYGWLRFRDVGDTRVVHEIQGDIERSLLFKLKHRKKLVASYKEAATQEGETAEQALKRYTREARSLKAEYETNKHWKEDALAALIVDARKKGLKQLFIPTMEELPKGATRTQSLYDAYYKTVMKKVGGFKKGVIGKLAPTQGYIRPLSITLPIGMGLFTKTNNNLTQ